ncbi:hypothetical protein [Parvibaculum sp.]|uniref:hypothetical protein n=1 Tax=Parvibaculum sp. TaxID=2024848 RepID=UPI001E0BF96E|nr:hypothetical protein [Parvibaculum sp.]MBX3490848.1 hypothetical protein [Parvibaculum sp.]
MNEKAIEQPLTATQLADALGYFWNAAIGAAQGSDNSSAFATVGAMAEGFAAVQQRLTEHAAVQPEIAPDTAPRSRCREEIRKSGKPYPRSCPACQFGPCKNGHDYGATSKVSTERLREMIGAGVPCVSANGVEAVHMARELLLARETNNTSGYAVKTAGGEIDVRTVSPTIRAAKVNGIVLIGFAVLRDHNNEYVDTLWERVAYESGATIVAVEVREIACVEG